MSKPPVVFSIPEPRSLDLIFTAQAHVEFFQRYQVIESDQHQLEKRIGEIDFILGQPPLPTALLQKANKLKAVLNVESNFLDNMDYEYCFSKGIYVLSTGKVFAEPVAEIGLGFALSLLRNIHGADQAFRQGRELWGGDGNAQARLLSDCRVGLIGFGDLGKALVKVLKGFRCTITAHDPWLPESQLRDHGVTLASLDHILSQSDVIFVVAAVTSENGGFLGAAQFASMRQGACLILLSRAGVVDFEALMEAVRSGHIKAASDVYPEEPLALDHPVRRIDNFLLSAHRAGALESAFKDMGRMVLEDLDLMSRGLAPLAMRRAERETVRRMRSKPVARN